MVRTLFIAMVVLSCRSRDPAPGDDRVPSPPPTRPVAPAPAAVASAPRRIHTGPEPIRFAWDGTHFHVVDQPNLDGEIAVENNGVYTVELILLPSDNTHWQLGDHSGTVEKPGHPFAVGDVRDDIGGLPVDRRAWDDAKVAPKNRKLELTFASGETAELELAAIRPPSLEDFLATVESGGLMLGHEVHMPKRPRSIYLVDLSSSQLVGAAVHMRDLDAVAIIHVLPTVKGTKTCTGYKAGDEAMTVSLQLKEREVVVYDRRSGQALQRKVFPPDTDCPGVAIGDKSTVEMDSLVPNDSIVTWLQTLVHGA